MKSQISRRSFIISSILAFTGLLFCNSYWYEKYVIAWKYFDLSKDSKSKIKIIQISDLHIQGLKSFHQSIANRIRQIKPYIICFTGDMVDDPNRMDDLDSFLKLLPPEVLKFAILGNWEYWGKIDRDQLSTIYNSHNCRLLINENITVELRNRDISIIGVDDYVGGEADFDIACKGLEEADYIVVLSHCPVYRDTIATNNRGPKIDMVLSGHTHGGQISLLGYAPFLPQGSGRYLKGRYHDIRPHLYVSKGIGTSVIPFRLGSRAEVAVFEI